MVNISTNTRGSVNVSARDSGSVNVNSNTQSRVDADTNGNSQRAKSWAVGIGLIDGEDYSAKYWAGQAKQSEEIASSAIEDIETAKDEAIEDIGTAQNEALEELETAKDEKIGEINSTATTFETQLTEIKNVAEGAAHDALVSEGNAQDYALAAQTAASTATTAVTTITQAVSTATTAATQATQAAFTAQTAANNAQGYNNQAKDYANRAGRNADDARSAALAAQNAMTTATTAATQATNARDYVVNALSNYYTKSETYTKTEVQQLIAAIPEFTVSVVESLPATGEPMVLYLVPKDGASPDVYNEYVWIEDDSDYELIGNTAIDLSDYVTTSDLTTTLADYALSSSVPTDTNDLTNGAGFITGITSGDVTTALGFTPYDSSNPSGYTSNTGTVTSVNNVSPVSGNVTLSIPTATSNLTNDSGFITSSDLPTNHVTTDTAQTISGRKTFTGEKAIYFKQSTSTDKLGFTLYNTGSSELGAFEYRPNTINSSALLNINCSYANSTYVGFRYWGTAVNIIAPKASAGDYYIPVNITNGTLTVTANSTGTVNISTLLPDLSGYALSSSLATVATSGSYNDLLDKPTIPTVNDATITFTQGGTTKGTITLNQSSNQTIALDAGGGGGVVIDDTTPSATTVYSSQKTQEETDRAYNKAESKADWFEIESPLTSTYDNSGITLGGNCYITSDGILKGDTAWNDGITDAVTSVNLIDDYWEWNGYFKYTSISAEEELIAVDGVSDNGFLFHIKPNGDVINPDDNNKLLANVYANDWVGFNIVHQAGDTDITVTLDNSVGGKTTTTTALATTTAQAVHNTCWHCNNSYGIEFLVRNDESWWKTSAGGTFYPFVTRYIGADLSSKQDILVSGTNIKTINNTSLLGSGNIDTSEIFIATYGTTTFADITTAYNAGKQILCKDSSNIIANLIFYNTGNSFTFATGISNNNSVEFNVLANNTWTTKYYYLADTDLSNLSSTGKEVIDGQWVSSSQVLISSATSLNGSTNLTYTVQVPNDGHVYEVLLRGEIETGSSSGNYCILSIQSNQLTSDWCYVAGARTRTSSGVNGYGAIIIPIKRANNNLTVRRNSNYNGNATLLQMLAYRRVGTNT